ncbi:MAG: hypothetical protein MHPSP_000946 [Paramarteilia canceri]
MKFHQILLIIFLFLFLSSDSDDQLPLFTFEYKKSHLIEKTGICPPGFYFLEDNPNLCIKCETGKTSDSVYNSADQEICNRCIGNYKKKDNGSHSFVCIKCTNFRTIALPHNVGGNICSNSECTPEQQYYDLIDSSCKSCTDFLTLSKGLADNAPALKEFCLCKDIFPRVAFSRSEIICVNVKNKNKNEYRRLLERITIAINMKQRLFGIYFFFHKEDEKYIYFQNCDPNRTSEEETWPCICNQGFFFRRKQCVRYVKEGSECPSGEYFADNECFKCPKGTYKENVSDIKCLACPKFKTTDSRGSKSNNDCTKWDTNLLYEIVGYVAIILICLLIISIIIVCIIIRLRKRRT